MYTLTLKPIRSVFLEYFVQITLKAKYQYRVKTFKLNNVIFLRYAIRGTQHRDTLQWVAALDRMRGLGAELMVPAHTQPLEGEQQIRGVQTFSAHY